MPSAPPASDLPPKATGPLARSREFAARLAKTTAKAPVHAYRWTLKPLLGHECRYLPTCSAYALDAMEINGAWRGTWLAAARLCRCHPWSGAGFDPAPDIRRDRHRLAPWRYGRWRFEPNEPNHGTDTGGAA